MQAEADENSTAPVERARRGKGRPHVLVIDDEMFIRDTLRIYLESNDFRVSTAGDADQAIEVFTKDPVDVAVLDLIMPGMHGLELLKEFKKLEPAVEVIIATGCGSVNSAVEALTLGAFDYITKPIVDLDQDLLKVVNEALSERQRAADETRRVLTDSRDWRNACRQLNELVEASRNGSAAEHLLTAVWKLFRDVFHADGAVFLVKEPFSCKAWGCAQSRDWTPLQSDNGSSWLETHGARIRTECQGRVVPVAVPAAEGEATMGLCLIYTQDNPARAEDGPLALVETVLGSLFTGGGPRLRPETPLPTATA